MKQILASVLSLFIVGTVLAQTAEDVISKHVEAMGGIEKLKALQTIQMEGVAVGPNGSEITTTTIRVQGKLYRQQVDFGMGNFTVLVTEKGGWFSNPRNSGAFEAMPAEAYNSQMAEMDCNSLLIDYAAKGVSVELTGTETINNLTCYVVKATTKSGKSVSYFIDNKSWMVVRTSMKGGAGMGMFGGGGRPGGGQGGGQQGGGQQGGGNRPNPQDMVVNIDYSDFKQFDGYWFPTTISRPGMGGRAMNTTIETILINKKIDERLYKPE
ncbi:MAG: hypothetical protein K2P88_09335 [Chitinophagaceae bacterium]|nr:hypothetical protein [Chitinophagaceae bacterium]